MSGYLYFRNNLKYMKDHIQAYMISCKIFFQLMVTVFKENLNLQLPLIFYSSIRFAYGIVFTSEEIAVNRSEALLEISDKFITKFSGFSYMVLQFRLKTVQKISKTILYNFKNSGLVVLTERSQFLPQKLVMKLLEMGKEMKIKHRVSSPPYKVWGEMFS